MRGRHIAALAACASLFGATACGSSSSAAEGGPIAVTLQEFAVVPGATSAPAGSVTFEISNTGPNDVHEFVVMKTDLAIDALPTAADGSVDEAGEGLEPIDEVEDIAVGASETLTVDLEAGSYVLICNIYDEDENEAHYQEGMRVGFTVT
jgi:uncharacterized cupredoxin-like copper-binding protein